VTEALLESNTGASGFVIITAPEPGSDSIEEPIALMATTLAKTLDPQGRLKGGERSVATGIVQLKAVLTELVEPSQLVSYVV
jgi:hypothetical protein